jgi:signal transduction histidine kinase
MTLENLISFRAHSVKARIVLLAILTFLLLAAAAMGFIILLHNGQSSTIELSERHLTTLAQALAQDSVVRTKYESQQHSPIALEVPGDPSSDQVLSLMTAVVLRHELGIEGGFYSRYNDNLIGYAFPTHEGPGPKKDIPAVERPTITDLARKAAITDQVQSQRFSGVRDVVVFVAAPVRLNGTTIGSTWIMQRLPGLNSGRNLPLLLGSAGFAGAAFVCALIAFFVATQVQTGVGAVLNRLGALKQDLAGQRSTPEQLAEFEQVLAGIDALALALREKIANERDLEARLRHQERLSSLGQFAAGIAHELRNPLATIRLRTQMSARADDIQTIQRNSDVIVEELTRLESMIGRLLYFSRPIHLTLEHIELGEFCEEILQSWSARMEAAKIASLCEGTWQIFCLADREKLRQVLDNLLQNAIDAIEEAHRGNGKISIQAASDQEFVEIRVEDNGLGLPVKVRPHVLDPFFTTKERGTGLGLSISYEIVKAHDGELRLEDRPEGGAVAILRIPNESAANNRSHEGGA